MGSSPALLVGLLAAGLLPLKGGDRWSMTVNGAHSPTSHRLRGLAAQGSERQSERLLHEAVAAFPVGRAEVLLESLRYRT
jgi:hypothetical protein